MVSVILSSRSCRLQMGNPTKTEPQARGPSAAAHSAPRAERRQGLPLLAGAEDNGWDRGRNTAKSQSSGPAVPLQGQGSDTTWEQAPNPYSETRDAAAPDPFPQASHPGGLHTREVQLLRKGAFQAQTSHLQRPGAAESLRRAEKLRL